MTNSSLDNNPPSVIMNTICKLIGLCKLSHLDVQYGNPASKSSVYEFTEETKGSIKITIGNLLFDNQMDNVLVYYNSQLFLCIPTDISKREYSRKNLTYHPLSDMITS